MTNKNESKNQIFGRIRLAILLIIPYIVLNMATGGKILTVNNLSSVFTSSVTAMFMSWCFCFCLPPE